MFQVTFHVGSPVIKTGSCTNLWILPYVFRVQFDTKSTSQNNSGSTLRTYERSHPAPVVDYWPDLHYQAQVSSRAGIKLNNEVFGHPHNIHDIIAPIDNFRGLIVALVFIDFTTRDSVFWIGDF